VGEATGKALLSRKHKVLFLDIDKAKLDKLNYEHYHLACDAREYCYTRSYDVVMFCINTPTLENGSQNLSFIGAALESFAQKYKFRNLPVIVIRSTVLPGTTRKQFIPILEKASKKQAGKDFGVCVMPEFLRAKSALKDAFHPWSIVVGSLDEYSNEILEDLYGGVAPVTTTSLSLEEAEFIKYICNLFNATKISFSNEMWMIAKRLGIDANKALRVARWSAEGYWRAEYGIEGGYPWGGDCLPKDSAAMLAFALKNGVRMPQLEATIQVNKRESFQTSGQSKERMK